MKKIYKYTIPVVDRVTFVEMPIGAQIKYVAFQDALDKAVFWVEVDVGQEIESRGFRVFGTGHEIPESAEYRGTAQFPGAPLVWHLYEVV